MQRKAEKKPCSSLRSPKALHSATFVVRYYGEEKPLHIFSLFFGE